MAPSGHRRNPFSVILFLAVVVVVVNKLVEPNTAVFGTRTHTLDLTLQWPRPATVEILFQSSSSWRHPPPGRSSSSSSQ